MLIARDYVGYMAGEVVKRLLADKMIEAPSGPDLAQRVRAAGEGFAPGMRLGVQYQEMYKKVKGELARQRKLILR